MMLRYKSAIALTLVTLFLAPLFSGPATMNTTSGIDVVPIIVPSQSDQRVLFDEAHCSGGSELMTPANTSILAWMLEEHGYEAEVNFDEEMDSALLTDIDVLALFFRIFYSFYLPFQGWPYWAQPCFRPLGSWSTGGIHIERQSLFFM